ncbi:hypothetical protein ElyMa_006120800, partial [Elysia marginata]
MSLAQDASLACLRGRDLELLEQVATDPGCEHSASEWVLTAYRCSHSIPCEHFLQNASG